MAYVDTRFDSSFLNMQFYVKSSSPTSKRLEWILKEQPDTDEIVEYTGFNLYYNILPINLKKINKTVITECKYTHAVASYYKRDRGYYIVEAILKDGTTIKSAVHDIYVPMDDLGRKMSKEFLYTLLNEHDQLIDNVPAFLYAKKPFGSPKCPKCTAAAQGALKSKCPNCLGTGFTGGFEGPLLIYLTYSGGFSNSISDQGNRISNEMPNQAETLAEMAIISAGDYVREAKAPYRLFCVNGTSMSEYNGRPMKVFLNMQVEESGHPLWDIDMPTYSSPKNIHYFRVREVYNAILNSVGKEEQADLPGFPETSRPTVARENNGMARYRYYLEEGS